jgi:hypothetical protein
MLNDKGDSTPVYASFAGEPVGINDILVKYTYNGDADLNGKIDADDYFQVDNGFAQKLTGYRNGDFDYNGIVDADDYFLIDRAFAGQTSVLAPQQPAEFTAANFHCRQLCENGISSKGAASSIGSKIAAQCDQKLKALHGRRRKFP